MKKIQLTIPEPCHENWDKMTPQDKGRFCAACQKTLVDFTNKGDREIAEFFKKPANSVCGRFQQDQLNRDIDIPKKRIPWIKYFFQFSLPAFLISAKASAQGKVAVKGDTICIKPSQALSENKFNEEDEREITGVITDRYGDPIPGAVVRIKKTKHATVANAKGEFTIKARLKETLLISSVGFESALITVKNFSSLNVTLKAAVTGEAMVILAGYVVQKPKPSKKKSTSLIKKITDTAFNNFSVYPNPTAGRSNLRIDCSKLKMENMFFR
jgi:hypothetical protein